MPGVKLLRDSEDSEDWQAALDQFTRGVASGVVGGAVHPGELASQIARESDLACRPGRWGPVAPNRFEVRLNKRDLAALPQPPAMARELERMTEARSMARGLRLDGPVRVWLESDPALDEGATEVRAFQRKGRRPAWALLTGDGPDLELTVNRSLVGRGGKADVAIPHDTVSPLHALIWREGEGTWVRDLGSAHGTFVGDEQVAETAAVGPGATVTFGAVNYLLREC